VGIGTFNHQANDLRYLRILQQDLERFSSGQELKKDAAFAPKAASLFMARRPSNLKGSRELNFVPG
jgi:hypothetical protein